MGHLLGVSSVDAAASAAARWDVLAQETFPHDEGEGRRVRTVRESLGGPWFANFAGWLVALPWFALLVIGQEIPGSSTSIALTLTWAVVQHGGAGVVLAAVASVARRRWPILPIPVVVVGWLLSAVARGVLGGLIAAFAEGARPEIVARILAWTLITAATLPLLTYLLSQVDHRRLLLGRLDAETASLRDARDVARLSAAARRHRLMSAVRDAVEPVMRDVYSSLKSLPDDNPVLLSEIAARLGAMTGDIERMLASPSLADEVQPEGGSHRAPFVAAVDFAPARYALSTVLPPLLLLAVVAPTAWYRSGVTALGQVVAATWIMGGVLALTFIVQLAIGKAARWVRLVALRVGFAVAALAAAVGAYATALAEGVPPDAILLMLITAVVVLQTTLVEGALGIAAANAGLVSALEAVTQEATRLHDTMAAREGRVAGQVAALLHGPVIGRLSACVMAINFLPDEVMESTSTGNSVLASRILSHLDSAARDLESLASH